MEILMHWNKLIILKAKDNFKELFYCVDLDGNGYIELNEFLVILQCIEPERPRDFTQVSIMFNEFAD